MRIIELACTALLALALAGCDGDARPFEEAVEVRTENLTSIEVVPPTMTVDSLFMNIGESVQFSLSGNTVIGQQIEISAEDRQWQVTDETVASIDSDGRLTAIANGVVGVFLSVGGLESEQYDLTVSQSTLADVSEIVGEPVIERCLPQDYRARGVYEDGSTRDLSGVNWTLAGTDTGNARLQNNPDTSLSVTGLNVSSVTLTASLSGFSEPLALTVADTLTALEISPDSVSLAEDGTRSLAAFGTYSGAAPGSTDTSTTVRSNVNVTNSVDWEFIGGDNEYASVSNSIDSRGLVTGLEAGTADLVVSCGNLDSDSIVVTVSSSSGDGLVFERGTTTTLTTASTVTLNVASGSTYSSANILDNDDLTWEFSSSDANAVDAISLVTTGSNAGQITPQVTTGSGTVTATDSDGNSASIFVQVQRN